MKAVAALSMLAVLGLGAACGSSGEPASGASPASPSASPTASGSPMDMNMNMDMGSSSKPSQTASMICGEEIRHAVRRTFGLSALPAATSHWSPTDRMFTCTYRLPGGPFTLSVHDALNETAGKAHFARLRHRIPGATTVRGVDSFGLPGVTSAAGEVAFVKDGKTLLVDARALSTGSLPRGYSRSDVAYSVASAVIACWSE